MLWRYFNGTRCNFLLAVIPIHICTVGNNNQGLVWSFPVKPIVPLLAAEEFSICHVLCSLRNSSNAEDSEKKLVKNFVIKLSLAFTWSPSWSHGLENLITSYSASIQNLGCYWVQNRNWKLSITFEYCYAKKPGKFKKVKNTGDLTYS